MGNFAQYNAAEVLKEVERFIEKFEAERKTKTPIALIYSHLSIFDWFKDNLTIANLKDMRKFLKEAIKLGFTGYVCFKVGASGCANGMWAHKEESTTGYSPDGDFLYKSFSPDCNYWRLHINDVSYPDRDNYDTVTTIKGLESLMSEVQNA